MSITNIFKISDGGDGGFDFPSDKVVLTAENLIEQGYLPLNNDLILTQDEAPKLYDIYKDEEVELELFTIKAVEAFSTDKIYWIYIE